MTNSPGDPALEIRGLCRSYGSSAVVADLDLRVESGGVYGFLGPNGAGKTTTMRMVLGLIRRDAGEVRIFGETDPVPARRRIGGIVEQPRFYPYLSGVENLRILAAYGGGATEERLQAVLEQVRLADRARDRVKTYSQGMRQRLGIAQALIHEPALLLLDEPTNGLDPAGMHEMRALVRDLNQEHGLTVFVSSHILSDIQQMCDQVGIIRDGRKVAEGRIDELLQEGETLEEFFLRATGAGEGGQIK